MSRLLEDRIQSDAVLVWAKPSCSGGKYLLAGRTLV